MIKVSGPIATQTVLEAAASVFRRVNYKQFANAVSMTDLHNVDSVRPVASKSTCTVSTLFAEGFGWSPLAMRSHGKCLAAAELGMRRHRSQASSVRSLDRVAGQPERMQVKLIWISGT